MNGLFPDPELRRVEALVARGLEDAGTSTFAYKALATVPNLITALRASQERVLELEGQLYDCQLENDDLRSQ